MIPKKIFLPVTLMLALLSCSSGNSAEQEPIVKMTTEEREAFSLIMENVFEELDTNKDGFLSEEEMDASLHETFIQKDSDGDNVIERKELTDKEHVVYFLPYDKNDDGKAEREEFDAHYDEIYRKHLDQDRSGTVSRSEFLKAFGL